MNSFHLLILSFQSHLPFYLYHHLNRKLLDHQLHRLRYFLLASSYSFSLTWTSYYYYFSSSSSSYRVSYPSVWPVSSQSISFIFQFVFLLLLYPFLIVFSTALDQCKVHLVLSFLCICLRNIYCFLLWLLG